MCYKEGHGDISENTQNLLWLDMLFLSFALLKKVRERSISDFRNVQTVQEELGTWDECIMENIPDFNDRPR